MNDIEDLIKESGMMKRLDHPNVMNLIGVCEWKSTGILEKREAKAFYS